MSSAVKRKLNALLGLNSRSDSNSNNSSTDSRSSAANVAGQNSRPATSSSSAMMSANLEFKKRRVGAPGSKPGFSSTESLIERKTPPIAGLRKWTPNGSSPAANVAKDAQPKYCPADREQLIKRLATFSELTDWTPKPERVSEIEWAKNGWVCRGKERVQCNLCHKELVVKLNRKEVDGKEVAVMVASEISPALVDKYVELMVKSHKEECLWRKKACDDSLLRLPLLKPSAVSQDLRTRYDELLQRKDFLPYEFNLRLPEGLDLDGIVYLLPLNFFTEPPPPPDTGAMATAPTQPNRTALALAILGWQGLSNARGGPVPNSASCHTCLRRLGLWMFKSKEVDPVTKKVIVPAAMDHLDPLREHRFFCPWKSGAAQRNPGAKPLAPGQHDKAGWEVLLQTLRDESFLRGRAIGMAGHGRNQGSALNRPTTPNGRPTTPLSSAAGVLDGSAEELAEDEETVRKKDQAMLARLRRVKSLFNPKSGSQRMQLSTKPSQFLESPRRRAGVYEVALKELEDLESEPLCHRVAARLLVNNCQMVDGKDEASVLTDSGRQIRDFVDTYAAALAICDLERGSFSISELCTKFREPALTKLALQNKPQLHVNGSEIDRCLESLATSDSAWGTWISYRHKAVQFCQAARVDNEKAQSINHYRRLTDIIRQLSEGVELEIQKRMEQVDLQAKQAVENLKQLNPQVKVLRDELARTQDYLKMNVEETMRKSTASMHDAIENADTLQQVLASLLKTVVEDQSHIAAVHETSLQVASKRADEELSGVMAVVAAVTASSLSLQEQMETSRAQSEALMHRQDALEKGMDRLLNATEDLTSKYSGHKVVVDHAYNMTNDILDILEATAATASSVQGSFHHSSPTADWWLYVVVPSASVIIGSYGLPPSMMRNFGLFAFGEFTAAAIALWQQMNWDPYWDHIIAFISEDQPEFHEDPQPDFATNFDTTSIPTTREYDFSESC